MARGDPRSSRIKKYQISGDERERFQPGFLTLKQFHTVCRFVLPSKICFTIGIKQEVWLICYSAVTIGKRRLEIILLESFHYFPRDL